MNQFMLCNNEKCELRQECYRYLDASVLSEYFQGNYDKSLKNCEHFIDGKMLMEVTDGCRD